MTNDQPPVVDAFDRAQEILDRTEHAEIDPDALTVAIALALVDVARSLRVLAERTA